MKEIILYNKKGMVLVDDEDYDLLSKYKWIFHSNKWKPYASRREGRKTLFMHRIIMEKYFGKSALQVDHKDGDGLNNQKNNLRYATLSQNRINTGKYIKNSASKYKGVFYRKDRKKWFASIFCQNKRYYCGMFDNENDAALAYNNKAIELFGEFAFLNKL